MEIRHLVKVWEQYGKRDIQYCTEGTETDSNMAYRKCQRSDDVVGIQDTKMPQATMVCSPVQNQCIMLGLQKRLILSHQTRGTL
jgi:hypothetical protein